ncbi:hypothetical protein DK871_25885 [Pseudomonas sp. L13]|nr:hypothetical protein [Pseudomonas sp. L13]
MIGWRQGWWRRGSELVGAWAIAIAGKPAPTLECVHRSNVGAGLPAMRPFKPPHLPADCPPPPRFQSSP